MDAALGTLKGIGKKTEALFAQVGVESVGDLLYYFPREYVQCPPITSIDEVTPGGRRAVYVQVRRSVSVHATSRLQTAVLDVAQGGQTLRLLWFRSPYIKATVKVGSRYVFYGPVTNKDGILCMEQPQVLSLSKYEELLTTLQPVYALTKGLTNNLVQKTIKQALFKTEIQDHLPSQIRTRYGLCDLSFALFNIHLPVDEAAAVQARNRLAFDEFYFFLKAMAQEKAEVKKLVNSFEFSTENLQKFTKNLPYSLTNAQKKALAQMLSDLHGQSVMRRLLQGDVGSGKTIVAFLAMLHCAENGYQSAMMAPTEVLARQHYEKLLQLCEMSGHKQPVILLTGALSDAQKRKAREEIKREPSAIIIGTHALFQEKVVYGRLALVVTDEQHRFGVKQRQALSNKGETPHVLIMSATPIPRTLTHILYGHLDVSLIDEVPAKRRPIKNCVVNPSYRKTAYSFLEKEVKAGHQAYVICPLVEASDVCDGENVEDYALQLQQVLGKEVRVGMLHGRMSSEEKRRVMEDFLQKNIHVLVSTTVVEVGVDVPNATVMMIENAERFGLAQLHQLRGRVGRGDAQSYCILVDGSGAKEKNARLEILNKSNDGFFIASEDLKLRGGGDFFGIRQSGIFAFRIADVYRDGALLSMAAEAIQQG